MRLVVASWLLAVALVAPTAATASRADNGVASMTPQQILAQVEQAVAGANSLHVYGAGTSSGSSISLDLKLLKGTGGAGRISVGPNSFDIIRIGQSVYIRAGRKFLTQQMKSASLAKLFANKWLTGSATTGDLASFTSFTDITQLTNGILSSPKGPLVKGATTTVNGHHAIAIVDKSDGGVLYVATDGPAYPLMLKAGKGEKGTITFDWNTPVKVAKPANAVKIP